MKYNDIPEGFDWENNAWNISPLMIDFEPIKGYKYGWKSIHGHLFEGHLFENGYVSVPHNAFPKMPSVDGRIQWKDAILCVLIDADKIMEDNFKEIDLLCKLDKMIKEEVKSQLESRLNKYLKTTSVLQLIKLKIKSSIKKKE